MLSGKSAALGSQSSQARRIAASLLPQFWTCVRPAGNGAIRVFRQLDRKDQNPVAARLAGDGVIPDSRRIAAKRITFVGTNLLAKAVYLAHRASWIAGKPAPTKVSGTVVV